MHSKHKASSAGPHEAVESKIRADTYGHVAPAYLYDAPVDGPTTKSLSNMHGDVHVAREHGVEGQAKSMDVYSQPGRQMQFSVSPRNTDFMTHNEVNLHMERKRKSDEARIAREVQAHEKKIQKELEKQDLLRRKRDEAQIGREVQAPEKKIRKELEKQDLLRRKVSTLRERKQKEERRREKEAARQKAAIERATARGIAKGSMELIEDERLELMKLAAASKGLPSIVSLDYDTLQNL
ncbi:UNVERIFIED_CONTAM: Homeobox-DDT domain protein RLT1 [Sesamum calycinum]|uniref:Homeobox-DDT domain protein RLT1 n=1 Tax=Sesamum calycinum TaxID=2727403 RepID=A0AAW2SXJ6_9LAMI